MPNIVNKIDRMRVERGWSIYKLAQEADISQQTFHQWLEGKALPSYKALQNIAQAYGITIAELVADSPLIEVTPEIKQLYDKWNCLTKDERQSVQSIVENYIKAKTK